VKHKPAVKKSHGWLRTRAKARDYIGDMHVFNSPHCPLFVR